MNSNEMCGCGTEENTSSAKGIVRINYKEDFELVVELLAGDKPYKLGDEDFRIDFIVMASRYTVGRTGGVCERCSVDGNKIRCFMDGHGLPPGELRAEVKVNTPDPNYADGKRLNVAIAEGTVELVKDNTRFDGAVVKANIPVVLIDAYQLAKAHGYKGTIDEYYATFTDVSALLESVRGVAEEENARKVAETKRVSAEKLRMEAETKRVADEAKIKETLEYVNAQKYIKQNEYEREVRAIEAIKNAPKDPTQDVWLDATDGEIKSGPATGNLTKNAITYYYLGKRVIKGNFSGATREDTWTGNSYVRHLDVRNWDMTLCTDAGYKFYNYKNLVSLDTSNWNLAALTNASAMFGGCNSLQTLDTSNWNLAALTSASAMFGGCNSLQTLDASGWNLAALTSASAMFSGCNSLQAIDFRKCTFHMVVNLDWPFLDCSSLAELWLPLTFDKRTLVELRIPLWGSTTKGLASLRWTFGEGADDRTAKGLQPCTVILHANVYDRLTDNERAAAAKKGWTITK
ncbi:BspA family leucine-rich repeat surface protein [Hallella colorans]|uniref:BspA family leucine-rich repeat surface protein n=1 Tax=Hallella colorans TaxID=1703337 RepID=UPI002889C88E|nr:BspA family leucine-rich repeat surface protein [Hallella colorans]